MIQKADYVLMVIIALLSFFFIIFFHTQQGKLVQGAFVVVTVNGIQNQKVPLSQDGTTHIRQQGMTNTFEVASGAVHMTHANCPDSLCLYQKPISRQGETIVCLPHKTVLKVVGGEPPQTDAVVE